MTPYNSKDLPSAGRQPVSLSDSVQKATHVDGDAQSLHSEDHLNTEGLRTRSPSPENYSVLQRTFSNSATTSDSPAPFHSCSSEDDVFKDDVAVPSVPSLAYQNGNAQQPEQNIVDRRALVRGSRPVDPQEIFSPAACIFVANLSQGSDDATIRGAVDQLFGQFGKVHIKIKRDKDRMPFAFCQYENQPDAECALRQGNGQIILGRKCRAERCKANVTFLVYKRSGKKVLIKEAHDLLIVFGPISSVCTMEDHCRRYLEIPPAMVVTFDTYDQHRDVVQAFCQHPIYVVMSYDRDDVSNKAAFQQGSSAILEQYHKDLRSIYLGQLPRIFTEDLVRVTVSQFGTVVEIQMKQNFLPNGSTALYAFVEFDDEKSPQKAVDFFNSKEMREHNIRAEKKKIKLPTAAQSEPSGAYRPETGSRHQGTSASNSSAGRYLLLEPPTDPFSGPPIAPAAQTPSLRAGSFKAPAHSTAFQNAVGAGPSGWGGHLSDTLSEGPVQSPRMDLQSRRHAGPGQQFPGDTQHPQIRVNAAYQASSAMVRGHARVGGGFAPPGSQQAIAQARSGYPNNHGQVYYGPMPNHHAHGPFNHFVNMGKVGADHRMDQSIAMPVIGEANTQPSFGNARVLPATRRVNNDSAINQRNFLAPITEPATAEFNARPRLPVLTAQSGSDSVSSHGDADFTTPGSHTESETKESPKAPSNAPLMPALNRVRQSDLSRSYSDTAERAATRAERAIQNNEAKQRRATSMKAKSKDPEVKKAENGEASRAQTSGESIVVANGTSTTPASRQSVPAPTASMTMGSSPIAFAHQYPQIGEHSMNMTAFFTPHMTQQGRPNFMSYVPHRMAHGMPYGMPGPMMPMHNPMGQGMMAPNMMPYGMQQHPMHYGYPPNFFPQHVFHGNPYGPIGPTEFLMEPRSDSFNQDPKDDGSSSKSN